MSTPLDLDSLLNQINGGQAAEVLPQLDALHTRLPGNPAILTLRAEALRHSGRHGEAIAAYQEAGRHGAGARNWLAAGVLLAAERATDQSVDCLLKALADAPDSDEILDALITTLFNGGRYKNALVALLVVPFFANYLVRMYGWETLLSDDGVLDWSCDLDSAFGGDPAALIDVLIPVLRPR